MGGEGAGGPLLVGRLAVAKLACFFAAAGLQRPALQALVAEIHLSPLGCSC